MAGLQKRKNMEGIKPQGLATPKEIIDNYTLTGYMPCDCIDKDGIIDLSLLESYLEEVNCLV